MNMTETTIDDYGKEFSGIEIRARGFGWVGRISIANPNPHIKGALIMGAFSLDCFSFSTYNN